MTMLPLSKLHRAIHAARSKAKAALALGPHAPGKRHDTSTAPNRRGTSHPTKTQSGDRSRRRDSQPSQDSVLSRARLTCQGGGNPGKGEDGQGEWHRRSIRPLRPTRSREGGGRETSRPLPAAPRIHTRENPLTRPPTPAGQSAAERPRPRPTRENTRDGSATNCT